MELANGKTNQFFSKKKENKYMNDDYDIVKTIGLNNVNMLLDEINSGASVLDIGCSYGKFGKELKNKNCITYGIDNDKIAAKIAINDNGYQDVFVFNVINYSDNTEYLRMKKNLDKVDVIIFSDIFEHLENPTDALVEFSKFLKEDGIILVSVPNIAHLDIILNLMDGNFNYTEMGILDNTHLKYFTRNSFLQWIRLINQSANKVKFDCEYLGATFYNNEYLKKFKMNFPKLLSIFAQNPNYNALQILFKLNKISFNDESKKLNKLLLDEDIKITKILGDFYENREINIELVPNMNRGEILWLSQQNKELQEGITWHQNNDIKTKNSVESMKRRIKELNEGLEWHRKQDEKKQIHIENLENKIIELNKGLEWHRRQDEEKQIYIESLENKIIELNKGLEWHRKQDEEKQIYIESLENKIIELNKGLEWHRKQNEDSQDYINKLNSRIIELESGLNWYDRQMNLTSEYVVEVEKRLETAKDKYNDLMGKLYVMENSFSWKITKFLRKKK